MIPVDVSRGTSPVILGFPHTGTEVPAAVWSRLNDNGRRLADTDWHIDRLYNGLLPNATSVRARFHRYVIDANRDPAGISLYPGQNTTGLVPITDFDGQAIWSTGREPDAADIDDRLKRFHTPYHAALASEIARVKSIHGIAVLYDCHSIRSRIPFLFEGVLPDFNIGTNLGTTCASEFESAAASVAAEAHGYSCVLNGRFKGGWTTRHYGQPEDHVHAIQMELAQSSHLSSEAPPFAYDESKAQRLRVHLKTILERIEQCALSMRR
ncbi:N-formylglutamate deformylase [Rhizobium sp. SSA_523]|uniref:N-formylglutamate deformylase n=1 Tax=Rhizobium sp. SSA_523 TaxID=2952477 RepID=UPI002090D5FE|nr:N-formylglutamate deformylase [Rhizobium sp. SSA_523]MCO5731240.1 N-formylglutamate deformylase [Rhizobium sp. SSA_523]WKC22222.1 N-formylglutamate deformylase [Rhizobium sp. SSA_523]